MAMSTSTMAWCSSWFHPIQAATTLADPVNPTNNLSPILPEMDSLNHPRFGGLLLALLPYETDRSPFTFGTISAFRPFALPSFHDEICTQFRLLNWRSWCLQYLEYGGFRFVIGLPRVVIHFFSWDFHGIFSRTFWGTSWRHSIDESSWAVTSRQTDWNGWIKKSLAQP